MWDVFGQYSEPAFHKTAMLKKVGGMFHDMTPQMEYRLLPQKAAFSNFMGVKATSNVKSSFDFQEITFSLIP